MATWPMALTTPRTKSMSTLSAYSLNSASSCSKFLSLAIRGRQGRLPEDGLRLVAGRLGGISVNRRQVPYKILLSRNGDSVVAQIARPLIDLGISKLRRPRHSSRALIIPPTALPHQATFLVEPRCRSGRHGGTGTAHSPDPPLRRWGFPHTAPGPSRRLRLASARREIGRHRERLAILGPPSTLIESLLPISAPRRSKLLL